MFEYAQVEATLSALPPLSRNLILKELLGHPKPPEKILPSHALVLWLANALARVSPVKEAEQRAILSWCQEAVREIGDEVASILAGETREPLPVSRLAIFDRGFATISGRKGFLNLHDGSETATLNQAPFESIAYDLTALYVSSWMRMKRMTEVKAKLAEGPKCQPPPKT